MVAETYTHYQWHQQRSLVRIFEEINLF